MGKSNMAVGNCREDYFQGNVSHSSSTFKIQNYFLLTFKKNPLENVSVYFKVPFSNQLFIYMFTYNTYLTMKLLCLLFRMCFLSPTLFSSKKSLNYLMGTLTLICSSASVVMVCADRS